MHQDNDAIPWKKLSTKQIISGITDLTAHWMMRILPIDLCSAIGGTLGKIIGPKYKTVDARVRNNIRFLRPDLTTDELEKMIVAWWENHGRVLAEFSVLRRIWKSKRTSITGSEHIHDIKKNNEPIIFLLLHTGNWEITGPKIGEFFNNQGMQIYQEIDNYFQMKIANNIRSPYADNLIKPHFSAGRKIYKKLMAGYCLVIAVDEHINGQLNGPAFGRELPESHNVTFALRLAKLTNAVLIPVYSRRIKGAHFNVTVLPALQYDFDNDDDDAILKAAQIDINIITENIIHQNVDQWYYATTHGLGDHA